MSEPSRTPASAPLTSVLIEPESVATPVWAQRVGARHLVPSALDDSAAPLHLKGVGCVLLDATIAKFVDLARRVHTADASVQVVAVTPAERLQATRRALLYAPGLGEVWIASAGDVTGALTERAAGVTRQRRRFERTRARIERERITVSPQRVARAFISDAYLAGLLRVLPDPVFSVDTNGRVLLANATSQEMFGGTDRDLTGTRLGEVLGLDASGGDELSLLTRAMHDGQVTVHFRRRDGERGTGELRAAIMDIGGTTAWAVVLRDITEQHATYERLQDTAMELEAANEELRNTTEELMRRTQEAERTAAMLHESESRHRALAHAERSARAFADEANRAKGQFLATMSHELRTPLNAISGHISLVLEEIYGPVTPAQRTALERAIRAQDHLLGLINDVLTFARMESGQLEYRIERLLASEVIGSVLPLVEPQLTSKQLTFEVVLPEYLGQPPLSILADRDKLAQILVNLLSNAIKFTEPGGRVRVELTQELGRAGSEEGARLSVHDSGIGIPPDKLDAIFEPFVQVRGDRTRTREGTGLGLAISRDLARGMGGDLTVESTLGEGSTFTVVLPIAGEQHRTSAS